MADNSKNTDSSTSTHHSIHSNGIYHGLPDLSHAPNGLTAVVTGSNGISGSHLLRVLSQNPTRWSKIYALSRRPPSGSWPSHIEHIALDLTGSSEHIAEILRSKEIKPDYVFWFAYVLVTDPNLGALQWNDHRLVDTNTAILSNFLSALPLANALPKRVVIQWGGKWYGVHLGASQVPLTEDQLPLIDPETGEQDKNLYYTQHALVTAFTAQHGISWAAGLPPPVIGATPGSLQTLIFPLLAYASVQKYLGKNLDFPSDIAAWWTPQSLANAMLNGYEYEWMALSPYTANQMFNVSDDSVFTWGLFWPRLAERFGVSYTGPETDETAAGWREAAMPAEPPPHGLGKRTVRRYRWSFVEWAKQEENVRAWEALTEKHKLTGGEWKDVGAIFGRADVGTSAPDVKLYSMMKAKKHGWFGFIDSYESMLSVVDEFVALKIVPDPGSIQAKA
ncbi:hypothetical protein B0A55_03926 [Friedmanniomyces simplex]|uniref:PRISE-like Rossmann-fold domain-containing protein n=1 Tax=Friedmanniomyces simplex TaxID=329884 RepID=A0A4U0XNH0_9PEZI|nr:hypothetical protein B0A55_03926 [Friedmanniomyces simplex]